MRNSVIPAFSVAALAAFAGACAPYQATTASRDEAYTVVNSPSAVAGASTPAASSLDGTRTGTGTIESLVAVARDSASRWDSNVDSMWRAGVRMDDGSFQTADTLEQGLTLGKRVQVNGDGKLDLVSNAPIQVALAPLASAATGASSNLGQAATAAPTAAPRAGYGRIETITAVPAIVAEGSAHPVVSQWRVGVRMDDGSAQVLDTLASGLSLGKRVQITGDGRLVAES